MQLESSSPYSCGLRVIARTYGDNPCIRKILSTTSTAVFVCCEESYEAILAGERESPMIGVPFEDVFQFDDTAAAIIAAWNGMEFVIGRPCRAGYR